jgi:hypothetical protein
MGRESGGKVHKNYGKPYTSSVLPFTEIASWNEDGYPNGVVIAVTLQHDPTQEGPDILWYQFGDYAVLSMRIIQSYSF